MLFGQTSLLTVATYEAAHRTFTAACASCRCDPAFTERAAYYAAIVAASVVGSASAIGMIDPFGALMSVGFIALQVLAQHAKEDHQPTENPS